MIIKQLTKWLEQQLIKSNKKGFVLGVSGGIDSTVMAKILLNASIPHISVYAFNLNSSNDQMPYIKSLYNEDFWEIDISLILNSYKEVFNRSQIPVLHSLQVNLEARIRASIFYHLSKLNNLLVIGTINKAEFNLGYFVKNTSIGDVLPFADLSKKQIRILAKKLDIPQHIALSKASGCNGGTYAENEWGMTEDEVDTFCEIEYEQNLNYELFLKMKMDNEHKRHYPLIFYSNNED